MWDQKLYHPANAVALYEHASGLRYKEVGPPVFSEQAWQFMSAQTHRKFALDNDFIIRISDWPTPGSRTRKIGLYGTEWQFMSGRIHRGFNLYDDFLLPISDWLAPAADSQEITRFPAPNDHSLLISLYGDDQKTHVDVWFCFYDLSRHQFYLDQALQKRNQGRVGPSIER
jgi:hypothetical protein